MNTKQHSKVTIKMDFMPFDKKLHSTRQMATIAERLLRKLIVLVLEESKKNVEILVRDSVCV